MKISIGFFCAVFVLTAACQKTPTVETLVSADAKIRNKALAQLERLAPEKQALLAPRLIEKLRDTDNEVNSWALTALNTMGESAIAHLIVALSDNDVYVRIAAADLLGRLGPQAQAALPQLQKSLNDFHPLVREEAKLALQKINTAFPGRNAPQEKGSGV